MKNWIVLISILCTSLLYSQTESKSLLWKISGNGLAKESYLFGTIHISCDATLPQKVISALNRTDQLYLELDLDDPKIQTEMMSSVMMKNGITIESLLSIEDFKIANDFFIKHVGISLKMMNSVKPFALSAMLYPKILDCEMQSIEKELMKITSVNKKETLGLENLAEQLTVFDAIPYQTQIDELMKSIKSNLTRDRKELNEILVLYQAEDLDGMLEYTKKSDNDLTSKFEDVLLTNRNENWIERIENIINSKSTFFGVGAAHLGGEKGVISLLRKKGYIVTMVRQ
jgi:uncharacterized protein